MSAPHSRAATAPARLPFSIIEEVIHHLDGAAEPWSVQVEARAAGRLDERRLRSAIMAALARHPMARARQAPGSSWQTRPSWEIPAEPDLDPLRVVDCGDDAALAALRTDLYSRAVPLRESPPLRARLARHPGGDTIMLNVNHSASDGIGSLRLLTSVIRAYAGAPDPVPDVDPLATRDLRARLAVHWLPERARRVAGLLDEIRRVRARMAADGGSDRPGYGFHTVRLTPEETAALAARSHPNATVNDLLLAALHLAIAAWNAEHGAPCGRIAIMMPVNLRPQPHRHEIVGNFSSFVTVSSTPQERSSPAIAVAAVAAQTRRIKEGDAATALIDLLIHLPPQPLWAKRAAWGLLPFTGDRVLDTAVLSNLGRLDAPPFGAGPGALTEVWFSPPARMPLGLALGAATVGECLHLSFRYRHPLLAPAAATRFADRYLDALRDLAPGMRGRPALAGQGRLT